MSQVYNKDKQQTEKAKFRECPRCKGYKSYLCEDQCSICKGYGNVWVSVTSDWTRAYRRHLKYSLLY